MTYHQELRRVAAQLQGRQRRTRTVLLERALHGAFLRGFAYATAAGVQACREVRDAAENPETRPDNLAAACAGAVAHVRPPS